MEQPPIDLNIGNICEGAIPSVFDRAVREILENISDVSTKADAKRKLTLTLEFKPSPDRRSAVVAFTCNTKTAGVEPAYGSVFFAKRMGQLLAYAEDPRQDVLFDKPSTEAKQ
jgi:hypothetical protein